jgi:hypothetical protein
LPVGRPGGIEPEIPLLLGEIDSFGPAESESSHDLRRGRFAPAAMADEGIAQTTRALTKDHSSTSFDPIGFEVVLRS